MNCLLPIGDAYLEKYTSLSETIISSFYGQLMEPYFLCESEFSSVFRSTTFEEFDDFCKLPG